MLEILSPHDVTLRSPHFRGRGLASCRTSGDVFWPDKGWTFQPKLAQIVDTVIGRLCQFQIMSVPDLDTW